MVGLGGGDVTSGCLGGGDAGGGGGDVMGGCLGSWWVVGM